MRGLLILKHLCNISDKSVVEQWSENTYFQLLLSDKPLYSQKCIARLLIFNGRVSFFVFQAPLVKK